MKFLLLLLPFFGTAQTLTVQITVNGVSQTFYTKAGVDKAIKDAISAQATKQTATDKAQSDKIAVLEKGTKYDTLDFRMVNGVFTLKNKIPPPYNDGTIKDRLLAMEAWAIAVRAFFLEDTIKHYQNFPQ